MGVLAGIQRTRHSRTNGGYDFNELKIFLHDIVPWGIIVSSVSGENIKAISSEEAETIWKRRVDMNSFLLILYMLGFGVFSAFYGGGANYHGQLVVVHMQLMVIVGLTKDGGNSIIAKLCNLKPMQVSFCTLVNC